MAAALAMLLLASGENKVPALERSLADVVAISRTRVNPDWYAEKVTKAAEEDMGSITAALRREIEEVNGVRPYDPVSGSTTLVSAEVPRPPDLNSMSLDQIVSEVARPRPQRVCAVGEPVGTFASRIHAAVKAASARHPLEPYVYVAVDPKECRSGACKVSLSFRAEHDGGYAEDVANVTGFAPLLCKESVATSFGHVLDLPVRQIEKLGPEVLTLQPGAAAQRLQDSIARERQGFTVMGMSFTGQIAYSVAPFVLAMLALYALAHVLSASEYSFRADELPTALPFLRNPAAQVCQWLLFVAGTFAPLAMVWRRQDGLADSVSTAVSSELLYAACLLNFLLLLLTQVRLYSMTRRKTLQRSASANARQRLGEKRGR